MKLATLRMENKKDGRPVMVSKDLSKAVSLDPWTDSLQDLIERWDLLSAPLRQLSEDLENNRVTTTFPFDQKQCLSPLPRAYQWADGSAFIHHIRLVRQARKAVIPETLLTVPLMYQGGSDSFLAPTDPIPYLKAEYGLDFESEVAVIVSDVPMGVSASDALQYIRWVLLVNDVTLRGLIPDELAQGFGFFQSKPSSAFSPVAVTIDELGTCWKDGRFHQEIRTTLNGKLFGNPNASEMHFHFGQLIAHAARTRPLAAGTIIGSGTVSNEDPTKGSSCLVEKRMIEQIKTGSPTTEYLNPNDRVQIEAFDQHGKSIFGCIDQVVAQV